MKNKEAPAQNKKPSAQKEQGWINNYRHAFLFLGLFLIIAMGYFNPLNVPIITAGIHAILKEIGILLVFIGIVGRILSSLSIASHKNKMIVNTEIYSTMRNPLYFFSFLLTLGIAISIPRIDLMIALVALFFLCFYPMIFNEEKYLIKKFGDVYLEYYKSTPRFFPNISKWQAREEFTINLKLVLRTVRDASISLSLIFALHLIIYFTIS